MHLNFYVKRTRVLLTDDIANFNRRLLENYKVTIVICILFASDSWFSSDLSEIFRYLNVSSPLSFITIEYMYSPFEDNICMQRKNAGKYGIYIYEKHLQICIDQISKAWTLVCRVVKFYWSIINCSAILSCGDH